MAYTLHLLYTWSSRAACPVQVVTEAINCLQAVNDNTCVVYAVHHCSLSALVSCLVDHRVMRTGYCLQTASQESEPPNATLFSLCYLFSQAGTACRLHHKSLNHPIQTLFSLCYLFFQAGTACRLHHRSLNHPIQPLFSLCITSSPSMCIRQHAH